RSSLQAGQRYPARPATSAPAAPGTRCHAIGAVLQQTRAIFSVTLESGWWAGVPQRLPRASEAEAPVALREVEQQPGDRLRVLELADAAAQLFDRNAHELDRLVGLLPGLALLDALRDEEPHPLAAEA